jgi:hypothetical protein
MLVYFANFAKTYKVKVNPVTEIIFSQLWLSNGIYSVSRNSLEKILLEYII